LPVLIIYIATFREAPVTVPFFLLLFNPDLVFCIEQKDLLRVHLVTDIGILNTGMGLFVSRQPEILAVKRLHAIAMTAGMAVPGLDNFRDHRESSFQKIL
jgi:hypothetical protein